MTPQEKAKALISDPTALGWALGYKDLRAMHGRWIRRMVTNAESMTLQAHRGSYKTTCLCIAIALLMVLKRNQNIIFLRKTDSDVSEVVSTVSHILQSPVFMQTVKALCGVDLILTRTNASEISTNLYQVPKGASQLQGIGIGGSLTGKHADIIITDDIVNLRDRQSRAERERTRAVYYELQNIQNRGGRIINTGTPWHPDDAFVLMPEPQRFDCYQTGLLSEEQITALRQSMTPSLFAANYELRHIASENALFTAPPKFTKDSDLLRDGKAHIDAAYGGDDYTAFTCMKREGNVVYAYGRMWQAHVDTVLETCIEEARRLKCSPIRCEDNGDKGFLGKEILRLGGKALTYHESENKYYKISSYLRKWWDKIIWLEGTDRAYIAQIMDYTEDAEHDDAPDSAAVLCRYFDRRSGEPYKSPFGG